MAAPYGEVRTTNAEKATVILVDGSWAGVDRCRSFIRNICEKNNGTWRMGTIEWRGLVGQFYAEPGIEIRKVFYKDEFLIAATLERVSMNPDGYLRLRMKGGVKMRKLIQSGQFRAPKLDMEPADTEWSEQVRAWSRS